MLIVIHIIFALASLISAALAALLPSAKLLKFSILPSIGTYLTGISLLLIDPATLPTVCLSGLLYSVLLIGVGLFAHTRVKYV